MAMRETHKTSRSALKFDLFAQAGKDRKLEEVGDPLQVIAKHIDFNALAALVKPFLGRGEGCKNGRPTYPVDVMVRILVLKPLYPFSDEQMEFQLLDRMSYLRFYLLEHSLNVPDRNTIGRFAQSQGIDGATALFEGAKLQRRHHGDIARGGQAIEATPVPAPKQHISTSAHQHISTEERGTLQEGQSPDWNEAKSRPKDTDATFTKNTVKATMDTNSV